MSDVERLLTMADDLRFLADQIQIVADWTKQSKKRIEAVPEQTEKKAKTYTLEEVRGKLGALSAKGHTKEVKALIGKYGAEKLSDISSDSYGSLLKEAEALANG